MAFGKNYSADANGGWKNHYLRVKRWENRSLETLNNLPYTDFQDALDFSLAYFLWSHSLREWLINDEVIDRDKLDCELAKHDVWKLCRDIANRTRHFDLKMNPKDKDWTVYREYDPFAPVIEGRKRDIANLMFDGKKLPISSAIRNVADMWESIISHNKLEVW